MKNIEDKKIANVLKKTYAKLVPPKNLQKRIYHSYQQVQQGRVELNKKNNVINNLLSMFQFKKMTLVGGAVAIIVVIGAGVMYIGMDKDRIAFESNEEVFGKKESLDVDEIVQDIDEELDTLELLAQKDKNSKEDKATEELDDVELNSLSEALSELDELDSILNEDVFDDELFL